MVSIGSVVSIVPVVPVVSGGEGWATDYPRPLVGEGGVRARS